MRLPKGYREIRTGRARAFALPSAVPWVEETLAAGAELHARALRHEAAELVEGRGEVAVIPSPDGRWAVRHYRRGGAVASLLEDRYLRFGSPRPLDELQASVQVRARGIDTPTVVAGAIYPAGVFYRADLVTVFVEEARELAGIVFDEDGPPPAADPADALRATGALVRRMAEAGVFHVDLNARNVLLTRSAGSLRALLLDLDRCRLRDPGRGGDEGAVRAMLERLERSLRKIGRSHGAPPDERASRALREGAEIG